MKSKPSRFSYKRHIVLFVGLLLLCLGVNTWYQKYEVFHGGVPAAQSVATTTAAKPSEQAVPAAYSVPNDQPLSISLPSIGAQGFIQKVSTDKQNQMVAPSNVNMAGWYVGSSKPGNEGLSIIDGHVHGLYGKGVFFELAQLKKGNNFTVTYGDQSSRSFRVITVSPVPVAAATEVLFKRETAIKKQLNLITCGGTYNSKNKSYEGRVIIVAEAI